MKKVVILGKNFNTLCGAIDFLRMIIKGVIRNKENCFYLLLPYLNQDDIDRTKSHFTEFETDLEIISYFHQDLNKVLNTIKPDIIIPACEKFPYPNVGYLYDCQYKYYPNFFSKEDIKMLDFYFQNMIDSKSAIIVNSNNTKHDLIKFYNAKDENIFNLPFCPILNKSYLQKLEYNILEKFNLPERYFIISNQFWMHKSHITAFKAIKILKNKGYNDICLVCTGPVEEPRNPKYINELKSKLKEWQLEDNIKFLGFIDKREQIELLKNAISVIQTTLFEGGPGGGSIYDAVSLGQRGILSDISINLELKNEANLKYFKSKNAADLSQKMEEDLNTPFTRTADDILIQNEQFRLDKLSIKLNEAMEQATSDNTNTNQKQIQKIYLFNFIPFIKIKKQQNKISYYLLNFFPLIQIKKFDSKIKIKLFNFIPILKIKNS